MNNALFLVLPDGRTRSQLSLILRELGRGVICCADPHEAMRQAVEEQFPVAIIDRDLPGVDGLDYVRQFAKACKRTHVVLLSDESDAAHTPPRAQLGISDLIYRPFKPARLMSKIERLCEDAGFQAKPDVQAGETRLPFAALSRGKSAAPFASYQSVNYHPSFLVAKSAASQRLVGNLWLARGFQNAVLLRGEDGCEFEFVLRELNQASGSAEVFPALLQDREVSLEALETLNTQARLHDGTPRLVFIPHVESLSDEQRQEVLTFVQRNRESQKRHVRVVLGSVTNSDLANAATQASLDEMAKYCEATLDIAPLRDRKDDIPLLARKILFDLTALHSFVRAREIDDAAMDYLCDYVWKGNYEQLVTVLRSAISSCPYRSLTLHLVQSLLHNDIAALHLLESVADEYLLPSA